MDGAGNAEKSREESRGEEGMILFGCGIVVGVGVGILAAIVTLLAVADGEERRRHGKESGR